MKHKIFDQILVSKIKRSIVFIFSMLSLMNCTSDVEKWTTGVARSTASTNTGSPANPVVIPNIFPLGEQNKYGLSSPLHLSLDSSENILIADSGAARVLKYSSSGNFVSQIVSLVGVYINSPQKAIVDGSGNTYILDSNGLLKKYDLSGTYVLTIGTGGSGDGNLSYPGNFAFDSAGNIIILDSGNHRIAKFNSAGIFVGHIGKSTTTAGTCVTGAQSGWCTGGSFTSTGSGDGEFNSPNGIFIDSSDNIYVADTYNHRVQKFNSAGAFQLKFGTSGSGNGQLSFPYGISLDSGGNIYVADTYNHRVQKFNSAGVFQLKFGTSGAGNGQFSFVYGIVVSSNGNIIVSDSARHNIQVFDSSGNFISEYGKSGITSLQFIGLTGVATDSSGNFYVKSEHDYNIKKFNSNGEVQFTTPGYGTGDGYFKTLGGNIAIDSSGNIYAVDRIAHRVQKFDSNGNFLLKFGTYGTGDGQLAYPFGIAVDSANGFVYVADVNNNRIQKFDLAGNFLAKWAASSPWILAVDSSGILYVGRSSSSTAIQKFDSNGNSLGVWGGSGTTDGLFTGISGIAFDQNSYVYVIDGTCRIQKFNSSGTFISKYGTCGVEEGQFMHPGGMNIDSAGNVFVIDSGNNRVQKFDLNWNVLHF